MSRERDIGRNQTSASRDRLLLVAGVLVSDSVNFS